MKHSLLKTIFTVFLFSSLAVLLITCQGNAPKPNVTQSTAAAAVIKPVPFPTNIVPGFKFPEDTATIINGWLGGYTSPYFDTVSIYKHAWGIWAGLTAKSGQSWNNQELLVYETWLGISEIRSLTQQGITDCPTQKGAPRLEKPRQINHAKALFTGQASMNGQVDETPGFWVTVAYDPSAACHATKYKLLDSAVIVPKIKPGAISSIPAFPRTAITTKPTYFVGKVTDNLIQIPVWTGAPSPAKDYPLNDWPDYVYVDVKNGQPAGKVLVPATGSNPTPAQISAATCNLSDFIYFKLDSLAAAYLNEQQSTEGDTAVAGDLALLVAMHVTTKEISNWTWQTYFWTPDPANPLFPSNKVAAGLRPSQLQGAASHYAVSTAYAMVRPNQPITGGTNKGVTPVIGYNPYLEPGLGAINGTPPNAFPNKLSPAIKWGVQSNCMSCHALAAFPGSPYTADQYISLNDPIFLGQVQLDFAWSLQSPSNMTNTAGLSAKK